MAEVGWFNPARAYQSRPRASSATRARLVHRLSLRRRLRLQPLDRVQDRAVRPPGRWLGSAEWSRLFLSRCRAHRGCHLAAFPKPDAPREPGPPSRTSSASSRRTSCSRGPAALLKNRAQSQKFPMGHALSKQDRRRPRPEVWQGVAPAAPYGDAPINIGSPLPN